MSMQTKSENQFSTMYATRNVLFSLLNDKKKVEFNHEICISS